jgi:protein arginine kinase
MTGRKLEKAPQWDVAISSRVRLARNLSEFPFPYKMSREQAEKVVQKVKNAVFNSSASIVKDLLFIDMQSLNPLDKQALVEKHLISPEMVQNNSGNGVILSKDEKVSILVNEEDHLRIQCLFSGIQLENAWQLCKSVDEILEEKVDYAFRSDYGYLTCCPTNIGTGIRASAMLHLPALVMTGYIREILEACSKLGVAVRGIYGEHSEALGNMFQISNQVTLGQSEEEIVSNINNVACQVIEQEKTLRNELYKQNSYRFEDMVYRSFGLFSNARVISTEESLKLLSDVRLGVCMGIIKDVDIETLNKIMLLIQPANLQKASNRALSADERDIKRAEIIRSKLAGKLTGS